MKGVLIAILSGMMSAAMAYGFAAGKPTAEIALASDVPPLWQNLSILVVILLGGFMTNCVWCLYLIIKNNRIKEFCPSRIEGERIPMLLNYIICASAGLVWYLQCFFYGMGSTKMGDFNFSSWTLHMASIIIFSTLWGILLKEWKGTGKVPQLWMTAGLAVLIISTMIIGIGTKMGITAIKMMKFLC